MSTEVRRIRLRAGLRELTPGGEIEPLFEEYVLGEDYDAAQKRIRELRETLGGLARGQAVDEFVAHVHAEDPDALAGLRRARTSDHMSGARLIMCAQSGSLFFVSEDRTAMIFS